jgi:hypothetical protein
MRVRDRLLAPQSTSNPDLRAGPACEQTLSRSEVVSHAVGEYA